MGFIKEAKKIWEATHVVKTWDELTEEQQAKALEKMTADVLKDIIEGGVRFDDEENGDDLQARIDRAAKEADDMQTPWFVHEYIMEDDYCQEQIENIALATCEDAFYPVSDTIIIEGIA